MNRITSISSISKSVSSGITPLRSNEEFWDKPIIPWLKTNQLGEKYIYRTEEKFSEIALEKTSIKLNPVNTLSIAMYGEGKTRGNVSILKTEMATNQACCNVVIDEKKADFEYVYYYLKTQYNYLRNLSSGVRKNLNSNDIKNFEIRLPESIATQTKIATVLSTLDKKIALNNRINSELEAMAKTLYDYWFVQFDFPISEAQANALGKPELKGKPYKSSGGKMVFNEALKREIPAGWELKELSEVSNVIAGGDKPKLISQVATDICNIPIYSNGIKNEGLYGFTNEPRITEQSVTISARGTIGYTVLRNYPFLPIIRLIVATPINNKTVVFLFHSIKNLVFENSGSVQQQLTVPQISKLSIVFPSKPILDKFEEITSPMIKKVENIKQENQQLTQLRDWLLPMLMNGQVTVK